MSGTVTASPSSAFATTPFSDAEKADVRRFCGYPTYGSNASGFQSWRFFTQYGLLEYRMNNFAPAEFANVRYFLSQLYPLESAVWAASANLDTDKAAVFIRNKSEVSDRTALFNQVRKNFCGVVGIPPGPDLESGGGRIVI